MLDNFSSVAPHLREDEPNSNMPFVALAACLICIWAVAIGFAWWLA